MIISWMIYFNSIHLCKLDVQILCFLGFEYLLNVFTPGTSVLL